MPLHVEVRFVAGLNDLLPTGRRGRPIAAEVAAGTTVKDLAESLGVPHTEIAVIVVNGESVDFAYQLHDGDRVSVYPVSEALGRVAAGATGSAPASRASVRPGRPSRTAGPNLAAPRVRLRLAKRHHGRGAGGDSR